MSYLRSRIAPLLVCLLASQSQSAMADQDGLILPRATHEPIALVLADGMGQTDPSDQLQVFVGPPEQCCDGKSAMAGQYDRDGQRVLFAPAFGLIEGQDYTVQSLQIGADGQITRQRTTLRIEPASPRATPKVLAVYPSGPQIPENTLRFYIHFSAPMAPHQSTRFVQLLDAEGTADPAAFMAFKQELWNTDRTRLTLLMDPGRIKRGVAQNLELGPALVAGQRYTIAIRSGWQNAQGTHKAPAFEQAFSVSAPLRRLPDIALWDIHAPRQLTLDPLVIDFDRPFDVELAEKGLSMQDENGATIEGTVFIENHQRTWRFEPQNPWMGTSVRLVVDARLEDVAGNNFRELLDHSVETDVLGVDQTSVVLDLGPAP